MNLDNVIRVPYTTRPFMVKNNEEIFNKNPDQYYISQKHHQLGLYSDQLYGVTEKCNTYNLIEKSCKILNISLTDNILNFALNFEEDVAIMYEGELAAICFCFPSNWIPKSRLGQSLSEIHKPVADGYHLINSSIKLTTTMSNSKLGSFKRQVWTITRCPLLSNFPDTLEIYRDVNLHMDNLFFRIETQTTLPLDDDKSSLFFVKVHVIPLTQIWDMYKNTILASVNSMSAPILEYKNLVDIKSYLNKISRL